MDSTGINLALEGDVSSSISSVAVKHSRIACVQFVHALVVWLSSILGLHVYNLFTVVSQLVLDGK